MAHFASPLKGKWRSWKYIIDNWCNDPGEHVWASPRDVQSHQSKQTPTKSFTGEFSHHILICLVKLPFLVKFTFFFSFFHWLWQIFHTFSLKICRAALSLIANSNNFLAPGFLNATIRSSSAWSTNSTLTGPTSQSCPMEIHENCQNLQNCQNRIRSNNCKKIVKKDTWEEPFLFNVLEKNPNFVFVFFVCLLHQCSASYFEAS